MQKKQILADPSTPKFVLSSYFHGPFLTHQTARPNMFFLQIGKTVHKYEQQLI